MKKTPLFLLLWIVIASFYQCQPSNVQQPVEEEEHSAPKLPNKFKTTSLDFDYDQITKETLDSIPGDELEQIIWNSMLVLVNGEFNNLDKVTEELNPSQEAFYATWIVESEVNNGGFSQLYLNQRDSRFPSMAVDGFKAIGAVKFADLIERANEVNTRISGIPINPGISSIHDKLYTNLDEEFYALYKEEDISKLRIKFIRKNIGDFVIVGE